MASDEGTPASGTIGNDACGAIGVVVTTTGGATAGFSVGEPHAASDVKQTITVCERCTRLLWHGAAGTVERALR
jgi:hypothetical protein